jgi:hypothetical protein
MNKYTKQATLDLLKFVAVSVTIGAAVSFAIQYFGLTPVITAGMFALLVYTCYNFIQIQAGILESKDKLNQNK